MFTRRRVVLVTVALLLVLDAGRSLYARYAAATPTRLWSPDPSYAEPIPWPPGSDLGPGAPLGQRVYARHCAVCHGPAGRGNGPAAPSLHPRPRDFTGGVFKLKSTPGASAPTLGDVRETIKHGMPGTSMPGWHDILSDSEIDAVADYIRYLGPHKAWAAEGRTGFSPELMTTASVERGRELYVELGCPSCHGKQGRGDGSSAKELKDVWRQPDPPRDLTAPWTFRGGSGADALYTRLALGVSGTPMPSYSDVADAQQIASVVAYIRSIARSPAWEAGGTPDGPGLSTDPVQRGEYLVRAGMCGLCHTPVDAHGIYLADTHYLAGGMKVEAGAHGIFFARNLTPDPDTGLGNWTAEQIATAIRSGHTPQRRLNYWGMPWMVLGALTHDDAVAIAGYLKTLPAVRNQVPLPLHYGFVETVARKLTYSWPALVPERLAYYAGNFGYEQKVRLTRDVPQRALIWAQFLVLGLGVVAFALRGPRRSRSRGLAIIITLFVFAVGAALMFVYRYPALDVLPTQPVVTAFGAAIPDVNTEQLAPHTAALLRRGRYLYSITSCPYCHNGNGAGGGKVNWSVFGTTWARNLTPHTSGLAEWSDEAVLRALVSGVSRDGRPLHWQAMIWDHLSNYTVEDQHALLGYVRALPAVDRVIPPPVPPRPDDCAGDTFWVGVTDFAPGCGP
jgi:mono/diheme cytochrome c family protein